MASDPTPPTAHTRHLDALADDVARRSDDHGEPYVVGIGGTVAAGKSTLAAELAARLTRDDRRVEVVPTDGFLLPNARLDELGLSFRKGAPDTYDVPAIEQFLREVRRGSELSVPEYSHLTYDVVPGPGRHIEAPDVVVLEGLNVVTVDRAVADQVDLTVFVSVDPDINEAWFVDRFMALRRDAVDQTASFFHQFVGLDDETALTVALWTWSEINVPVAREHVLPAAETADVVVQLDATHHVHDVRWSDG